MSADQRTSSPPRWSWSSIDAGIVALLIALSIAIFLNRGPTAYDWPAIDMAAFYERQADPAFLPHDDFTNAASQPNPRLIFGNLVLGLIELFRTDWYAIYFALKVLLVVAFPPLWYLTLLAAVRERLSDDRRQGLARVLAGLAVALIMNRNFAAWFSIAWWTPYPLFVGPHPFSLLLGLLAIVIDSRLSGRRAAATLPLWIAATLIHPAIGLIVWCFAGLTTVRRTDWIMHAVRGLLGVLLPALAVSRWYRPASPLSTAEFTDVYLRMSHPFHYDLAQLGSHTKYPWWVSLLLLLGLMAATGIAAWRIRRPRLAALAGLYILACTGSLALQYVGAEVWPSKQIVQLGPTRFCSVGFYLLAVLVLSVALELKPPVQPLPALLQRFFIALQRLFTPARTTVAALVAAVALFANCRDDLQSIRDRSPAFYDWVDASTSPDAVFHLPYTNKLHQDLPVLGRRAVLASEAFPFREDAFREYARRLEIGYGSLDRLRDFPGRSILDRRNNFYRSLTPADFVRIADQFRLDYAIVDQSHRSAFVGRLPCFEDEHIAVFALETLRKPPSSR